MSMTYIGRLVHNLKEFYTEINGATLTGAIDVVVVEQPDGSYTCSPFHVRFGKLGVLRSRQKVVDIEINGEPVDIHMKLGESGEAFFVEEVSDTESEILPDHLATSPIPASHFEELYKAQGGRRRNSADFGDKKPEFVAFLENEVFDYGKRRYTADDDNRKVRGKDFLTRQIQLGNIERSDSFADDVTNGTTSRPTNLPNCDTIFTMDDVNQPTVEQAAIEEPKPGPAPVVPSAAASEESGKEGQKARRRRRKKSNVGNGKKKTHQRKNSASAVVVESPESEAASDNKGSDSNTDKSSTDSSGKSEKEGGKEPTLVSTPEELPPPRLVDPDIHFFSDTELTANQGSRPNSPTHITSDTEFEVQKSKLISEEGLEPSSQSWNWGEFPQPEAPMVAEQQQRHSMLSNVFSFMKQNKHGHTVGPSEGIYLSDIGTIDPQTASKYFSSFQTSKGEIDADMDCESGNGPSLAQSPNSAEGAKSIDSEFDEQDKILQSYNHNISISMCGWDPAPTPEHFQEHVIPFSDLCNDPTLFDSENLVVCIKSKYFTWKVAAPIMSSLLIYQRPLPQSTVDRLINIHMASSSGNHANSSSANRIIAEKEQQEQEDNTYWNWMWRRSRGSRGPSRSVEIVEKVTGNAVTDSTESKEEEQTDNVNAKDTANDVEANELMSPSTPSLETVSSSEKCRKSLRLSSSRLATLNLNDGVNQVEFSVTTAYQGTTRCSCNLYKWRWDDKIVISDIDGTITKSDVLGHILPIVGADWAQTGVAQLFNKIKNNGYKLMYLSARAIGQAKTTREYLRSLKQEDIPMPDGPILLNPTSLITAFHREVIEKKPEQFKISCMSDIKALFPPESNPFYAGYGNRINDVWAYRAVGIPIVRIFTINSRGELKHELTQTFQSSYANMSVIVDQLFPEVCDAANDYSQFVYWREPVAVVDELPELS